MGIKQAIRNWLNEGRWDKAMEEQRQSIAALADELAAGMTRDAGRVRRALNEELAQVARLRCCIQQRAPRPMWRKFGREALGPDYGCIASAASTATYPAFPAVISIGQVQMALPNPVALPHAERGFVAAQHIPVHPHHKLPAFDFGDTEVQALFNLSQQMAQIALHEGWSLTYSEN